MVLGGRYGLHHQTSQHNIFFSAAAAWLMIKVWARLHLDKASPSPNVPVRRPWALILSFNQLIRLILHSAFCSHPPSTLLPEAHSPIRTLRLWTIHPGGASTSSVGSSAVPQPLRAR